MAEFAGDYIARFFVVFVLVLVGDEGGVEFDVGVSDDDVRVGVGGGR